jgi:hypothetical protein
MRHRIYISGPMSGLPDHNFPAFHAEAARLRLAGYDVVNPAELGLAPDARWAECMRAAIPYLLTCDTICLLQRWATSRGARLEFRIAASLGFRVLGGGAA